MVNFMRILLIFLLGLAGCSSFGGKEKTVDVTTGSSKRADQLVAQASQKMQDENFEGAVALLNEAKRLQPEWPRVWTTLGIASARLGNDQMAKKSFKRALAIHEKQYRANPSEVKHVKEQVYLLILLNRDQEAKERLARGQSNHPNSRALKRLSKMMPKILASDEMPRVGSAD